MIYRYLRFYFVVLTHSLYFRLLWWKTRFEKDINANGYLYMHIFNITSLWNKICWKDIGTNNRIRSIWFIRISMWPINYFSMQNTIRMLTYQRHRIIFFCCCFVSCESISFLIIHKFSFRYHNLIWIVILIVFLSFSSSRFNNTIVYFCQF